SRTITRRWCAAARNAPHPDRSAGLLLGDRSRGIDQREVAQPLREVAEEVVRAWVDLLGEESDVVREADDLVHRLAALGEPAGARERLDQPERARDERTLHLTLAAVAVEQRPAAAEIGRASCRERECIGVRVR